MLSVRGPHCFRHRFGRCGNKSAFALLLCLAGCRHEAEPKAKQEPGTTLGSSKANSPETSSSKPVSQSPDSPNAGSTKNGAKANINVRAEGSDSGRATSNRYEDSDFELEVLSASLCPT